MHRKKTFSPELLIGVVLVLLAWWAEVNEDLNFTFWERIVRATFLTAVQVGVFFVTKYYLPRIQQGTTR